MKDKISLTKQEKEKIKDSRPSGVMDKERWAELQGMSHSEFKVKSNVGSYLEELEKKYKK